MREIRSVRSSIPVLLAAAVGGFSGDLGAGGASVPKKLTPETFEAVKARVSLTPEDLAWQKVNWRDGFLEGLVEAQAADKPLFFWLYGGGGGGLSGNC